jgi:hypothetical protein
MLARGNEAEMARRQNKAGIARNGSEQFEGRERGCKTRTTGQPVAAARSAVEPSPAAPMPSKSPMTPSQSTSSDSASRRRARSVSIAGRIAQGSRLMQGPPEAAAWKEASM